MRISSVSQSVQAADKATSSWWLCLAAPLTLSCFWFSRADCPFPLSKPGPVALVRPDHPRLLS